MKRRDALKLMAGSLLAGDLWSRTGNGRLRAAPDFRFRYILASSLYGTLKLKEILPEVARTGCRFIDIWPRGHADQREQIEEMGHEAFGRLLQQHGVQVGILTHYDLGPFGLQEAMNVGRQWGTRILICGSVKRTGEGPESLNAEIDAFIEKMKPHVAAAEEAGVTIGIENHGSALIRSPDSIRYLAEKSPSPRLGIALAPYHLPQDPELIAGLIRDLGPKMVHFYAWQHGKGAMKKLPKAEEMEQLPGYGSLDFVPVVRALKETRYQGWTSIFMHPVPRGIPILPTAREVTDAVNRSRRYLEECLQAVS